jgi:Rps23 Pro-64 3,4-dihydroxylase Tpa1-like proline 4-hydroxylase
VVLGLDSQEPTAGSRWVGEAGCVHQIANQTGHTSMEVLRGYIRHGTVLNDVVVGVGHVRRYADLMVSTPPSGSPGVDATPSRRVSGRGPTALVPGSARRDDLSRRFEDSERDRKMTTDMNIPVDVVDFARLDDLAERYRGEFAAAEPFPHVAIDDFLPIETAERVHAEFQEPLDGWKHYYHVNERKLGLTEEEKMPPYTRAVFEAMRSPRFVDFITKLSDIEGLISDPTLEGGGMHMSEPGGFLNMHTDFLTHTKNRSWRRHLNLLVYLNKDWKEEWNGDLELWDAEMTHCAKSVAPVFNRCVIFNTVPKSYHGHPHRLACPPGESRKSILLYYYRDEGKSRRVTSTDYRPLPDDSAFKKILIAADRGLVRTYTFVKGRTGLTDRTLDRILRRT